MSSFTPDRETSFKVLEKILKSEDFLHNDKYQVLLKFLVNALLNSQVINEKLLAIEIFGKDDTFDPAVDSSVRTYMSNLRKKVEYYNLTIGKDRETMLTLPKGGYHVEFVNTKKSISTRSLTYLQPPHAIYILIILILIVISSLLLITRFNESVSNKYISKNDAVWHNLFNTPTKTLIVLGDYYFFKMPLDSQRSIYARDIFINSDSDLNAYLADNPEFKKNISTIYHTYLDENIPFCVSHITPSFVAHDQEIEFKLSSEIRLEDLQNFNVIYIGSYKTLYLLETVTVNLNFNYELKPNESLLKFFCEESNKVHTYSFLTNPDTHARNDYAMVVKVSGHNNNTLYFFLSQHDFGNMATVKYFTNLDRLEEFQQRMSSEYFEALFEVTGIIRTDFDINLLHVNELNSNFKINLE